MTDKIQGGYILLARNIIESQIWQKPAEYLKVWIYILTLVSYKKTKKNDLGEYVFNFKQAKIPGVTTYQIYEFLRWAKTLNSTDSTTQITTQKTTRGTRLKVTKYAYYQDVKNYVHQNTYQQLHQQIPNTITKTLNNNIKSIDIYKSLSLTKEEREVLKNYIKKLTPPVKNINAYIRKLIENGDYVAILNEEKARIEKEKQKAQRYALQAEVPPEKNEDKALVDAAMKKARAQVIKGLQKANKGEKNG